MSDRLWNRIEELNWASDHDIDRVEEYIKNRYSFSSARELAEFADSKVIELCQKYEDAWLGVPGIACSDDSWSDLAYEVVGRGREFFETITASKLREMANTNDYQESFGYCFVFLYYKQEK
tara:strand:- start:277 stop:639 length:363 start_codon:yes stop_codon:yes gene_type:complete